MAERNGRRIRLSTALLSEANLMKGGKRDEGISQAAIMQACWPIYPTNPTEDRDLQWMSQVSMSVEARQKLSLYLPLIFISISSHSPLTLSEEQIFFSFTSQGITWRCFFVLTIAASLCELLLKARFEPRMGEDRPCAEYTGAKKPNPDIEK